MDTLTITEDGDTFTICAECSDDVESCTCPTDGAPHHQEDVTRGWMPRPDRCDCRFRDDGTETVCGIHQPPVVMYYDDTEDNR